MTANGEEWWEGMEVGSSENASNHLHASVTVALLCHLIKLDTLYEMSSLVIMAPAGGQDN